MLHTSSLLFIVRDPSNTCSKTSYRVDNLVLSSSDNPSYRISARYAGEYQAFHLWLYFHRYCASLRLKLEHRKYTNRSVGVAHSRKRDQELTYEVAA